MQTGADRVDASRAPGADSSLPFLADEGERLQVGAVPLTIKASAALTGGAYCLVESVLAPRLLSPPHYHATEDQLMYILEGTVGFRTGDEEFLASVGTAVFRPRGVPHALWNPTDQPARVLEITSPSTIETFFRRAHELAGAGEATPEALRQLGDEHGITPVKEWIDDLCSRHGVSLTGQQQ